MGVLNFNTNNLITGINIIENNLYWTDNNSEPKKLELDVFRGYDHSADTTTIEGNEFIESDVTVIRLHPWEPINMSLTAYTPTDAQPEPPFEEIFPRFSYRWRYEDGQFSPYAPFTQAAFIPAQRTNTTDEENYTEGFNTTMFNNVGTITLDNIPRGPRDVVAVDILYTESISTTIYVLETLEIPPAQRGFDYVLEPTYTAGVPTDDDYALLPLKYELSARKIYRALPPDQLLRPYDEVPQRALAQEVTANRLLYGNYQVGFDFKDTPENVEDIQFAITTELTNISATDGLHVKGNRAYEIGVVYIDNYGRQSQMIQAGSITADDGTVTEQIPLQSAFNQAQRQQITATITSPAPYWADRYRYFIKDVSMDHHNLISYNIYNDGSSDDTDSDFIWIEFQSTDRNKLQAADNANQGTVLVLRRTNEDIATSKQRFLVQDIQNEAPEDVRRQIQQVAANVSVGRIGSFSHINYNLAAANGTTVNRTVTGMDTVLRFRDTDTTGSTTNFNTMLGPFIRFIGSNQPADGSAVDTPSLPTSNGSGGLIDLTQLDRPLYASFQRDGTSRTLGYFSPTQEVLTLVRSIEVFATDRNDNDYYMEMVLGENAVFNLQDNAPGDATGLAFPNVGLPGSSRDRDLNVVLYTTDISEQASERLQGRFWVRASRNDLPTLQSSFTFSGELIELQQLWFETEPIVAESQLDIFYETSDSFCVKTQHGWPNRLNWFNCVAESTANGVYLETTRTFNKFNSVQLVKGVRVNTPSDRNAISRRLYDITWSGIFNSRTNFNELNQFIVANGIVKRLEPNYGSIQKLHTRNTNVVVFTEDKVFNILADKDQLFNADGGGNVSATNAVLGQTTPYTGEYGIGQRPESFATYGYRAWFADPIRGVVVEFIPATGGQSQLQEISGSGLNDFFRDRLFSSTRIYGMFDDYSDKYILSLQGYDPADPIIDDAERLPEETQDVTDGNRSNLTVGYELDVQGWPSRMSFIPEFGLSLNNKFFTWKNGQLWRHNSNVQPRNNFYGNQFNSEIELIFNDDPSAVKEFMTLNYEGTNNWEVVTLDPESDEEVIYDPANDNFPFVRKEGKYFKPIVHMEDTYIIDPNGSVTADDGTTMLSVSGSQEKGGIKGFYLNVRLRNTQTTKQELFSVGTENYISSN